MKKSNNSPKKGWIDYLLLGLIFFFLGFTYTGESNIETILYGIVIILVLHVWIYGEEKKKC